nr:DivIVA domain-containing protein [Clostridia bacterium]
MVAPHELKNKKFTNAMRGYSMAEVDDHIDFIIAQYTELYRQNADLEQRLMRMQEYISELEGKETEINGALVDAQKAAARTLSEANEQAETVMLATKTNCDKIMAQFRYDVEEERAKLNSLRAAVREFKAAMFETYRTHIEFLEQIAPGEIEDDTEDYTRKVVGLIKDDIISKAEAQAAEEEIEAEAAAESEPQAAEAEAKEVPQADVMTEAAE